ncbi:MAG TPA: hypothetical protein ENI69_00280 [Rhodospirillales bacterium]|nr:hypothetical protein [Rhodospirillales bacterium]
MAGASGARLRLSHNSFDHALIGVADLDLAADYLKRAEVPFERGTQGLAIDPASACGAVLKLVP